MEELVNGRNWKLLVSCATSIPESSSPRLRSTIFSGPDSYMTTDAKCIAVVLSLILILKEQCKENNKMKLKDVMMRAKCGVLGALVATGLTAFAEPEAVQLWENGPYWATSNLGESEFTTRPEYGALYKYDEADAAVKQILGPEWRLPTEAEFSKLINDSFCRFEWNGSPENSLTIRGRGAYMWNSITLHAGGYSTGNGLIYPGHYGLYWTSSAQGDYFYVPSLCINTEGRDKLMNSYDRDWGLIVRPVRDTPPPVTRRKADKPTVMVREVSCDLAGVNWISYELIGMDLLSGMDAATYYQLVFDVVADGQTKSVKSEPMMPTDGAETKKIDTAALFGRRVIDPNAKIRVSLVAVKLDAVQLWKDGPYWATSNLGESEFTHFPEWGALYTFDDADAAVKSILGQEWRVPTEDELAKLYNDTYCHLSYDEPRRGFEISGVDAHLTKKIFLPAAGYDMGGGRCQTDHALYWSSSEYSYFYAYGLVLDYNGHERNLFERNYRMSVRAVRDDAMTQEETIVDTVEEWFSLSGQTPGAHAVPYVGAYGSDQIRSANGYVLLTADTDTMSDGRWYVVTGMVSRGTIKVNGSAHLILCDGAVLTVNGKDADIPGIVVEQNASLSIYGQRAGTGRLEASSCGHCAGIGGPDTRNAGDITINGGTVTAEGGSYAAGIGAGHCGAGGTITINGGTVSAHSTYGPGIGSIVGGAVKINGGTVTATSFNFNGTDWKGVGIQGKSVTVSGGSIFAYSFEGPLTNVAGKNLHAVELQLPQGVASPRKLRFYSSVEYGFRDVVPVNGKVCLYLPDGQCTVSVDSNGLRYQYSISVSGNNVVCSEPEILCVIVIGLHPGLTASWTSGDGTVSHEIEGTFFTVPKGTANVRVSFAAQSGRVLEGESTVSLGTVNDSVTFDRASGLSLPTVKPILPTGYVSLDWIASDGGQYIDTEYVHTANTRVECSLEALPIQHSNWSAVFGARNGSFQSNAFCFFAASDRDFNRPRYNRSGVETLGSGFPVGKKTVLTCNGLTASWQYDGNPKQITTTGGRADAGVNTMFVFNLNTAGSGGKQSDPSGIDMRLYGFQIFEGDSPSPVRDFVPCVDPLSRTGLYDLGNGRFYANVGSGKFEASDPDVFRTVTIPTNPHMNAVSWTIGDWAVTNAIVGSSFKVLKGTENVKVIFSSNPGYTFADGSVAVGVLVGTVEDDCLVVLPEVRQATVETFDEGHYLESSGLAWVDTEYVHTATTRVVCVLSVAKNQPSSWAAVFGARRNVFQSNAFCFFAKCDNDVNKACYNRSGNEKRSETAFPKGEKTTLTCDGANATWATVNGTRGSIVTTGMCDDGVNTMFVFNLNTGDVAGKRADPSPIAMKLYSFKIYEGETLVRDFVPARTKDERKIVGLYDRMTGKFFVNCGSGDFTLGRDPTCEGGTIEWSGAANVWTVTPTNGAVMVTIAWLPSDAKVEVPPLVTKVSGVVDTQIRVRSGAYDITGAFTVSSGAIALNENGSVTIGGEGIPVKPTIGDLVEGKPFTVGEGSAAVTVRAIPGLKYELVRGSSVAVVCGGETPLPQVMTESRKIVCETVATGATMLLVDSEPPTDKAFYRIEVSVP